MLSTPLHNGSPRTMFVMSSTLLTALVFTAPVGAKARGADHIKPGKKYTPPLANFTVPAPTFCLGTGIQKDHARDRGMVAFVSDVGQLSRIDYVRLESGQLEAWPGWEASGKRGPYQERLEAFLEQNEARLVEHEPLQLDGAEALFAVAEFPGGRFSRQ